MKINGLRGRSPVEPPQGYNTVTRPRNRPAGPVGPAPRTTSYARFVRLCYDAVVRTTLDISDEAYYIAKAIARDRNRSLGRVVGDLILESSRGAKGASIKMSDYGFPIFRCARPVTTEDVKALDDEE